MISKRMQVVLLLLIGSVLSSISTAEKVYDYQVFISSYDCTNHKDGFYADPEYCHLYWRCNYEIGSQFECQVGTLWNDRESKCDWADLVDCSRYNPTTTTTTVKTTTTTTTTTSTTTTSTSATTTTGTKQPGSNSTLESRTSTSFVAFCIWQVCFNYQYY